MAVLQNRVQETTISTGTGTLTLAGAVSGYRAFNSAYSISDVTFYTIDDGAGGWEIGQGTVGSGTLTRDTVLQSSNANALVNFSSGTKRVFASAPTRVFMPDMASANNKVLSSNGTDPLWVTALNGVSVGATTASTGAFTTLSATSTVSGAGFTALMAAPGPIGSTTASTGAFTTLSASSTVSGAGFSTYLASPPAIGGTLAAAGTFTTLGVATSISGTGWNTSLASPPAIGGTSAAAGTFTNLAFSGTLTGSATNTVLNIGSGQIYKENTGRVALNTTSTYSQLTVAMSAPPQGIVQVLINTDISSQTGCQLQFTQNTLADWSIGQVPAVDAFAFYRTRSVAGAGSELMRIDSGGRLGIGTSSPSSYNSGNSKLVVAGANAYIQGTNSITLTLECNTASTDAVLHLKGSGGNVFSIQQPFGSAGLFFYDISNTTERMRIDANGYLLVGYGSSNGAYKLQVNSQIFATNATIATSDRRYKENIEDIVDGLALVKQLRPVTFNRKPHPVHDFDTAPTIGFIAQEVQNTLQDQSYVDSIVKGNTCMLPDGTEEEFLGLGETCLIPLITKALQELCARVERLESK